MTMLAVDNLLAEPGRAEASAGRASGSGGDDSFDRAFAAARERADSSGSGTGGTEVGADAEGAAADDAPPERSASGGEGGGAGEGAAGGDADVEVEADAAGAVVAPGTDAARGGKGEGQVPERPGSSGSSGAAQPGRGPWVADDAPPGHGRREAAHRDARQGQGPASLAMARPAAEGVPPNNTGQGSAAAGSQGGGERSMGVVWFGDATVETRAAGAGDAAQGASSRSGAQDESAEGAPQRPPAMPPILRPVAEGGVPQSPQGASPAPAPAQFQMPTGTGAMATIEPVPPAPAQASGAAAAAEATAGEQITRLGEGDPQRVAEQALRAVRSGIHQRGGTVTLQLNPPELGTLKVRLDMSNHIVRASFEAATDAARALLQGQLTGLRTALEAHGLTVENLQVQAPGSQQANQQAFGRGDGEADDGRSRGSFDQQPSGERRDEHDGDGDPRSEFERELLDLIA